MKLLLASLGTVCLGLSTAGGEEVAFREKTPLPGVRGVTSVNIGDINRDGLPDIAVFEGGKHNKGTQYFAWFEAPRWTRHDFNAEKPGVFIGDTEMADLNGDGWLDIVVPRDGHSTGPADLSWYENPKGDATGDWVRHAIYVDQSDTFHQGDIEIADMDNDGRLDVVCRHLGQRRVRVCLQNADGTWTTRSFDVRDREGLKLADLDRDGVMDIVMNGFWWAGPKGGWRSGNYAKFTIDDRFFSAKVFRMNNSTKNGIGDLNGDGRVDVGLVSAEGNKVCLVVYLAPPNPREQKWQEVVLKEDFGNCHQLEVADVDLDGDLDLVGGRSFGESGVFVWYNQGDGTAWTEQTVDSEAGMYSGVVGDLDSDGDVDFVAPNSYANGQTVWIFENLLTPKESSPVSASGKRDGTRPGRAGKSRSVLSCQGLRKNDSATRPVVPVAVDSVVDNDIRSVRASIRDSLGTVFVEHNSRCLPTVVEFDPPADHLLSRRFPAVRLQSNVNLAPVDGIQRIGRAGDVQQWHGPFRLFVAEPVAASNRSNRSDNR